LLALAVRLAGHLKNLPRYGNNTDVEVILSTGRRTTRLGFGCAFPRSVNKNDAARCLDAAYDAGIRHFDVAPSYADGAAEGYLGNFLKKHNGWMTVTTKYGILPPVMRPLPVRVARPMLGPVLRTLRRDPVVASGSGLSKSASAMNVPSKAAFSAAQAKLSLARSLEELQLDMVDMFLMDEPGGGRSRRRFIGIPEGLRHFQGVLVSSESGGRLRGPLIFMRSGGRSAR